MIAELIKGSVLDVSHLNMIAESIKGSVLDVPHLNMLVEIAIQKREELQSTCKSNKYLKSSFISTNIKHISHLYLFKNQVVLVYFIIFLGFIFTIIKKIIIAFPLYVM